VYDYGYGQRDTANALKYFLISQFVKFFLLIGPSNASKFVKFFLLIGPSNASKHL